MTEQAKTNHPAKAQEEHGKGFAITSMVCGIIALVFCWNLWIAIILAIIALVFGIIALVKKYPAKGMAIAGVVTGGIGLVLTIVLYALIFSAANSVINAIDDYDWSNYDWSEYDWSDWDY